MALQVGVCNAYFFEVSAVTSGIGGGLSRITKVFVLGLDGATLNLVKPWANGGRLPNFAKIIKNGVYGNLTSTVIPETPPAWASFMTGKNPGKHGVFDFEKRRASSFERHIVNFTDIDGKPVWSILSEAGMKVIVVGVPLTYPVRKVNGIMVPGFLSPPDHLHVYPPDLGEKLVEEVGGYRVYLRANWADNEKALDAWLQDLYSLTRKQEEATLYLMGKYNWDFFMVVFMGTDWISHNFWKYVDSKCLGFNADGARKYGNTILQYYKEIDSILGKVVEQLQEDTVLVIMSDHGNGPVRRVLHVNEWLKELGLLKLRNRPATDIRNTEFWLSKFRLTNEQVFTWLANHPTFMKVARWLVSTLGVGFSMSRDIDWSQTKAYDAGYQGQININVKGREPEGIVELGREYERLRDYIIEQLHALKDPESGERIIDKVFKREEIYCGSHIDEAPDILFLTRRYYTPYKGFDIDWRGFKPTTTPPIPLQSSQHEVNGLLLVYGKGVRKGVSINGANIVDLTPTILQMMGVPVPSDMDGRVLKEVFEFGTSLARAEAKHMVSEYEQEKLRVRIAKLKAKGHI